MSAAIAARLQALQTGVWVRAEDALRARCEADHADEHLLLRIGGRFQVLKELSAPAAPDAAAP